MIGRIACVGLCVAVVVAICTELIGACYNAPQPDCGFLCGPSGACPADYTCASDRVCHLNSAPASLTCPHMVDAAGVDTPVAFDGPPDGTPITATLTANKAVIAVGGTLMLTGTNFGANESVNLAIGGQPVAAATATGAGTFSVSRVVPAGATQGATTATAAGTTTLRSALANVTLIRACNTGTDKCVFVTSVTSNGDLGGLAGADATCAARATAVGLTGTFKAWLSTSATDASSRIAAAALPYVRVDEISVAATYTALTSGTLDQPINVTELRATYNGPVWTDTNTDGTSAGTNDCGTWADGTSGSSGGEGASDSATSTWTVGATATCDTTAALYCVEQ